MIEAASEDSAFEVELLLGPLTPAWQSKVYLNPTAENVPRRLLSRGCRAITVRRPRPLIDGLVEADAVIAEVGRAAIIRDVSGAEVDPGFPEEATRLLQRQLWCAVFDADHSILPANHFEDAEIIFWPSPYWLDCAVREGVGAREDLESRSYYAGYVRADNLKHASRLAISATWGINPNRPVVLYIPDVYRLREERHFVSDWYIGVWCVDHRVKRMARGLRSRQRPGQIWRAVADGRSHARMITKVRGFCDRNSAQLVMVRRRQKDWLGDREFTHDELSAADAIIQERDSYPQTMSRAMRVADLAICPYRSGAVLEAITAGTPYITVALPYYADSPIGEIYNRRFDAEQGHWPGATWHISADEFIRSFSRRSLQEFAIDPEVLQAVRARYTGPVDGRTGERILGVVKERLFPAEMTRGTLAPVDPG